MGRTSYSPDRPAGSILAVGRAEGEFPHPPRRSSVVAGNAPSQCRPFISLPSLRRPTPELAASWVERTPPGFTMNVKAWSLLTGHPTFPHSLWPDLQGEVPTEHRDKRRLYASHLSPDVLDEAFARFRHALLPLAEAGKLGTVLLQFPRWFTPK